MKSFPILAALVLIGCSTAPPPPRLSSVTPARVSPSVATPISIRGEGLEYAISADLDRPSQSAFVLELKVRLIGPQTVELTQAQRPSPTEVQAEVPSGLMLGKYTVEVSTARGVAKRVDALEVASCLLDCLPPDGGCFSWPDLDRDSYGQTGAGAPICPDDAGVRVGRAGDCQDTDPATNPDAVEMCNGLDDDCDGRIDDGTCTPDSGWKLRPDTGGPADDWETAANYGRGRVWLAEKQRVFLRPGSGNFGEVGSGCANKLLSSWSDPITGVSHFGGENVFTTHTATSTGCGNVETLSGTIVGLQGFGSRVYGATRDGRLVEARTGSVSVRPGIGGGVRVNDVQGASPNSLFAVGEGSDRPKVWRMTTDGGPVVDERVDLLPVPDQEVTAVWAVDDGLAYAVGSRGALLERTDGGWRALGPADGGLRAVRAFGPGRIYAATSDGRVLRYDGTRWQLLYRHPVPVLLTDITASAEDDIWVVGYDGVVVHWLE